MTSGGFACDEASSPCVYNGSYGTSVVFTAAPAAGQRLLSWTGCTSSNASTCTVLLNQASGAKNVTAAFGPNLPHSHRDATTSTTGTVGAQAPE